MTNQIIAARDELHALLLGEVSLPDERIGRQPPPQPVPPTCWIDVPDIVPTGHIIEVSFPVFLVVDGDDEVQVDQLDNGIAEIYDAVEGTKPWRVDVIRSLTVDIGLNRTRGAVATCVRSVAARTLCPPRIDTGGTP